jgi:iron complex transport system substrate-binding protein
LNESIPKTIEEIFSQVKNVDIWLNPGPYNSKHSMLYADKRIQEFPAFSSSKIYNNNKRVNNFGGNDFWESGVVQPDRVLNDLIIIFSQNENIENDLYYYKLLE